MEDGHCKTVDEVINYFNVDPDQGLSPDQVKRNQEKYGLNGKQFVFLFRRRPRLDSRIIRIC